MRVSPLFLLIPCIIAIGVVFALSLSKAAAAGNRILPERDDERLR